MKRVSLWLTNEQGTYEFWIDEGKRHLAEAQQTAGLYSVQTSVREQAAVGLADQIREAILDGAVLGAASVYTDLLTAALNSVEWMEVAENFMPD